MWNSYKSITTVSTGLYVFRIPRASYLDIRNPLNQINVIASIYIPSSYYDKITKELSGYNKELHDSYKLYGIIVDVSYREPRYSELEKNINKKPVEILSEDTLEDNIEMITNHKGLYQLTNNKGGLDMIIKINIF
ncbi:MAG: hypothetical protein ACO2ON_00750 [Candidatus Nanopusillus sp.]